LLIVLLLLLVIGPRRVTNFFRALGRGVGDFVEGLDRGKDDRELPEEEGDPEKTHKNAR
jgi:Sec-independent protein translocase protein TatA